MRVHASALLAALLAVRDVLADTHHVFVSSFTSPHLYSLQYDDETNKISQAGHIIGHDGHPWISFSYDKSALYAGERNGFASYSVENSTSLAYRRSVALKGTCGQKIAGFGSTYVLPLLKAPFTVYGAPFGSCLNAISVEPDGTLQEVVQNIQLEQSSGIHGLAMDPENHYLYSADDTANGIWVHQVDTESGSLTQVAFTPAPEPNAGPRHLIVHPNGKYLYVVMEAKNEVAIYAVNWGQRSDKVKITFTGMTYSLLPKGTNPSDYLADEVILSTDNNILFASTRYRAAGAGSAGPNPGNPGSAKVSPNYGDGYHKRAAQPGYVTAILLIPQSEKDNAQDGHTQGPGFPLRELFQVKTSTSGGMSNAVSPAPWDSNYFAISDTEVGQVEIWKITGAKADRTYFVGTVGQGAATPAKGGWEDGMWVENPTPTAPKNPGGTGSVPKSTPNPYGQSGGNPFQQGGNQGGSPSTQAGGNPWGQAGPKWGGQGGYGDRDGNSGTWGGWGGYTGGDLGDRGDGGDRGDRGDRGGVGGRDGGDDDDDEKKHKSKPHRRQLQGAAGAVPAAPVAPVAPPPAATAKVVATWKAPQGVLTTRRTVQNRRTLMARQSFNSTVPPASGCCGNALWWD